MAPSFRLPQSGLCIVLGVLILLPRIGAAQQPKIPSDLWQKAQEKGVVRVIVELNVAGWVSKKLSKEDELVQRKMIVDTQNRVLAELKRTRHKVNRRFEIVPALAMEVEPDALVILDRSPHVLKVYEDVGLSPTIEVEEVKKIPETNQQTKIKAEIWAKAQKEGTVRVIIDLTKSKAPSRRVCTRREVAHVWRSARSTGRPTAVVYLLFTAAAFRINATALAASSSDSNPRTAEYFLRRTWAKRKFMLIPASAIA